jgi:hypothetical protein
LDHVDPTTIRKIIGGQYRRSAAFVDPRLARHVALDRFGQNDPGEHHALEGANLSAITVDGT